LLVLACGFFIFIVVEGVGDAADFEAVVVLSELRSEWSVL
jgi:hypothetical protein